MVYLEKLFVFACCVFVASCGSGSDSNLRKDASFPSRFNLRLKDAKSSQDCKSLELDKVCYRLSLHFEMLALSGESILQQPLSLSSRQARIKEPPQKTDAFGRFTVQLEVEREVEAFSESVDLALRMETKDFGSQFIAFEFDSKDESTSVKNLRPTQEKDWSPKKTVAARTQVELISQSAFDLPTKSKQERPFEVKLLFKVSTLTDRRPIDKRVIVCTIESADERVLPSQTFEFETNNAGLFELTLRPTLRLLENWQRLPVKMTLSWSGKKWIQRLIVLDLEERPEKPVVAFLQRDESWAPFFNQDSESSSSHELRLAEARVIENPQKRRWILLPSLQLQLQAQYDVTGRIELSRKSPSGVDWIPLANAKTRSRLVVLDARRNQNGFYQAYPDALVKEHQTAEVSTNGDGIIQFHFEHRQPVLSQMGWNPIEGGLRLELPQIHQASRLEVLVQPSTQIVETWNSQKEAREVRRVLNSSLEAGSFSHPSYLEPSSFRESFDLGSYTGSNSQRLKTIFENFRKSVSIDDLKEAERLLPSFPKDFNPKFTELFHFYWVVGIDQSSLKLKQPESFSWLDIRLISHMSDLPPQLNFEFSGSGYSCLWLSLEDTKQKKFAYRLCDSVVKNFSIEESWAFDKVQNKYKRAHGDAENIFATKIFPKL